MKISRKLVGFLLLLLLAGIGISPAGAAEVGNREIDVYARYKTNSKAPASYSVDLAWSDMTFTYTREETLTWNPKDHSYKSRSSGKWDKTKGTVTVTNHSNVDIQVTITYIPLEDTGITGTLRNGSRKLKAGKEGDYAGADSMTATLTIKGEPSDAISEKETKIGSLRITIR